MSNEARKALDQAYEKLMKMSLNQVPIDGLENLIHPDIMGWGTTLAEEVQSIDEYVKLIKQQGESAKEQKLTFIFNRDKIHEHFSADEKTALFVEKINTTINSENFSNSFTFRFSAVMVCNHNNWQLIHWHGSIASDIEDDVWHVDEWKKEKKRLEKLVNEQTKALKEKNRETQIELSLERIRAQVSSMQTSPELLDIVVTMRSEFISLGLEAHYFWYMRWYPEYYEKAMTSGDGSKIGMVMTLPKHIHTNIKSVADWENSDEPTMTFAMDTEQAVDYVDKMISLGDFEKVDPQAPTLDDIREIGGLTFIMARTSLGEIGFSLPGEVHNPSQESLDILTRFASVFDLAYQRFEDLQKAETQAYESRVEASLEKVRAMAANMNHSEDLVQIVEAMFEELEILKITPLRYGVGLIDGDSKKADLWVSAVNDGNHLKELGTVSLTMHPMLEKAFEAWENQLGELFYPLSGKELSDYYRGITRINPDIPKNQIITDPNSGITQYCSFFPFRTGSLYAFTESEPDEHGISVLKRFANVFEQAYTRFEDLQKTELQARLIHEERDRLEITLKELQATQEQLIQQEKLASLGQLTAGIAHEIKNPLNFVNNFSDLSVELIEETLEELNGISDSVSSEDQEKIDEAIFILKDIDSNLKKIHEHGTRADSIVKSMLEHSRGGAGVMEPTDLNSLIKEFLNLSFHGMRAGKNSINVDINSTLDNTIGEVPLIAEDFSRVIVNLCNNAFDAMREKQHTDETFKAKLTVRTINKGNKILVEIEDNGPGISAEMKDKIMQPFFTTKKGTQGTGLGLSITNDIIKAHGGNLILKSKLGDGASFIIELPGNN